MGQVTIYLPDEVEKRVRREAKRAGKSLSSFVTEQVTGPARGTDYLKKLDRLFGSCKGLEEPEDLPPEDVPSLD